MMKMNRKIELFVPAVTNSGEAIYIDSVLDAVTEEIGGVTTYNAEGAWFDGGVKYEDTLQVFEWFALPQDDNKAEYISKLLSEAVYQLLTKGGQICVSIKIAGELYIVNTYDLDELEEIVKDYLL